ALDAIVNQAMNLEPTTRYPSVRELGSALLAYAGPSAQMMWTPFFGVPMPEINFAGSGPIEGAPPSHRRGDLLSDPAFGATPPPGIDPPGRRISAGGTRVFPSTPSPDVRPGGSPQRLESSTTFRHASGESTLSSLQPRRSRLPLVVGLGVVAAVGAVFFIMRPDIVAPPRQTTAPTVPPEPKLFRVEVVTEPSSAVIELDGQPVGTGAFARRLPIDGSEHEVVAHARGYRNTSVRFTDTPPPRELALEAIAAPPPPVTEQPRPHDPIVETAGAKPDKSGHGHHHHGIGKPGAPEHADDSKPPSTRPTGKGKSGDGAQLPNNAPIVE
ncbi:MAG TPA: hypothetical protein VGL59_25110, partial [Polyangia bacterium]